MSKILQAIDDKLKSFIQKQHIFFVATAMQEGRINLSPKGMDTFRIINDNKVIWLNLTGSGNETAIHLEHSPRMTIMFCSFEKNPMILRLYGNAKCYHKGDIHYDSLIDQFPTWNGARQVIDITIDKVQTSCGYAVPFMEYIKERDTLDLSLAKKEASGN